MDGLHLTANAFQSIGEPIFEMVASGNLRTGHVFS